MKRIKEIPYLIEIITIVGLVYFIAQSWYFAHSLVSISDEGSYLYKGYMFARGDYRPFQEYAFWTNKSPLSFLIPGYIQLWFGPGLRAGRYFAVIISFLTLIGVWVTANRLGGKGWAAVAVWVFSLSAFHISISSMAVSQGLVACMMAWILVCVLGENRALWHLVLGSGLSVLVAMTRQNMIVVPILLVAYIFWQYGRKAGWWVFITSAVIFTGFHIYYWPNILQLWSPWLPEWLTPFLDYFRNPSPAGEFFENIRTRARFQSLAIGINDHFFILYGSLSALILWPKKDSWKSRLYFRMAVFLATLFFVLFLTHAWASLFGDYCVYCFSSYQVFYSMAGFFLILVVLSNGVTDSLLRRIMSFCSWLFFAGCLGLFYYQSWGGWILSNVHLLRISQFFIHGNFRTVSLGEALTYAFNLPSEIQKRIASSGAGIFSGIIFIILIWALHHFFAKQKWAGGYSLVNVMLVGTLFVGTTLPVALRSEYPSEGCSTEFLSYYEKAGETLADLVPSNSLVYWNGNGRQLALMLYMDDVRIFPAQIHGGGGFVRGTNSDWLWKFGRYNKELDTQWRTSADYLLIAKQNVDEEFQGFVDQTGYEVVSFDMGGLAQCEEPLLVFRRRS